MSSLKEFQINIGYEFKDISLLEKALTHSSYANENGLESNERMEFLGDAVLELCMSKYLYNSIDLDEGVLTKTRAKAVCESALNIYASHINIQKFILLGKGEEQTGGRERPAIIADAVEAVLGAVFLDSNFDTVYNIIQKIIIPYMDTVLKYRDYKSILQEKLASEKRSIRYDIINSYGPPNNRTFEAVVYMDDLMMGQGKGKTKKEAEQMAAKKALDKEAHN